MPTAWHNGPDLKTVLGASWCCCSCDRCAVAGALAGCRSDAPGIRRSTPTRGRIGPTGRRGPTPSVPSDAAGGGVCPINFCGQAKRLGLPSSEFPQSGADSAVRSPDLRGRLRAVDAATGSSWSCVDPLATGLAFGVACSPDPGQGMRCADDSLCITAPDFPQSPFCSDDVPQRRRLPDRGALPGASDRPRCRTARARRSGCACPKPRSPARSACARRPAPPDQGCVLYGGAPSLRVCRATAARSRWDRRAPGQASAAAASATTATGTSLTAANRAYCSGACTVNSDCGPDQRCVRLVVGNNGTPGRSAGRPGVGLLPHAVRAAAGDWLRHRRRLRRRARTARTAATSCTASAIKKAAVPGSACTARCECPLGGVCSMGPRFAGGYCQTFGCDPAATSGANACPGSRTAPARSAAVPTSRSPAATRAASRDAGSACSRASAGYACESATAGVPPAHLPGGQRDVTRARADRGAGCGSGRGWQRVRAGAAAVPAVAPPPPAAVAHAPQPAAARAAAPAAGRRPRSPVTSPRQRRPRGPPGRPDSDRRRDARGLRSRRDRRSRRHRGAPLRSRGRCR